MQEYNKLKLKLFSLKEKNDLDKVREYKRKTRQPQTLICFKVFSRKTPEDLCKKLFGAYSNSLPFDFFNVHTRIDYDYTDNKVHSDHCLLFYIFSGCVPAKVELKDFLYVYRNEIDPNFNDITYKNLIRFHGSYIQKLSFDESKEKIKIFSWEILTIYIRYYIQISLSRL